MKILYVDIDETICMTPYSDGKSGRYRDYHKSVPIEKNINKINKLYENGHTIVYWTSRGSRTQYDWYELTYEQLNKWGVKFHELRVDKPFYDFFIDDKTLRIEEDINL